LVLFPYKRSKDGFPNAKMIKPKSPERSIKKKTAKPKTKPEIINNLEDLTIDDAEAIQVPQKTQTYTHETHNYVQAKMYPESISKLIHICLGEASEVKEAFKNRNRQAYIKIFNAYNKDKLTQRDYSIIRGAMFYLYEFSRANSIDKATALWMIGIYEIPVSQIVCYTSKEILKNIAKDQGLSYSNKKAEELVNSIRGVIDRVE
jgi:hypothetical protein